MTTIIAEPILGLEQVQRAMLFQLMDNVNPALAEVAAWMADSDQVLATRQGADYTPTVIEPIAPQNFVEGHRPSLIDAPVESYPNCAVWAVRAEPTAESAAFDQISVHTDMIYVEVMVKSIASEEEVNRRIQRTVEAVNIAVMQDRTLGGAVQPIESDPVAELSDVFTRKERTAYGAVWFWQGARLEYAVRKEAVYPSSDSGSFFRTPQYEIDQD